MTTWKPGDVAMVTAANRTTPYRAYWDVDGSGLGLWREYNDPNSCLISCASARPLVVIDPESADDVERLLGIIHDTDHGLDCASGTCNNHTLADALREFANPTPPKPAEPTGLGAVVEDAAGQVFTRTTRAAAGFYGWRNADAPHNQPLVRWNDVEVVRVLSEGIQ